MKNLTIASITTAIAAGFAAAVFGLAAPANADVDHHQWISDIQHPTGLGSPTVTFGNGR
ncbi:MAG: hypothetical protein ABW137_04380 [Mycobacterium sp.]